MDKRIEYVHVEDMRQALRNLPGVTVVDLLHYTPKWMEPLECWTKHKTNG